VWDFDVVVKGLVGDVPGALLIILNIFDWNVWRILVMNGLLHPHVQMGRSILRTVIDMFVTQEQIRTR